MEILSCSLECFSRFGCHRKNDHCCFLPQRLAPFYRPRPKETRQVHRRRCQVGDETVSSRAFWEVDIAGGREFPLIGVFELHVLGLITCVGCDILQADHAPEAGVAQGIFHGILVRHHGRNQEEVEEGLEEEVERRCEENTQEQVRMPMTKTHRRDLSHM